MDYSIKQLGLLSVSLVLLTNSAHAVDDMDMRNLENRVTALEQKKAGKGVINPPTTPVVKGGFDFWVQGEALYLHATEDNLNYSIISHGDDAVDLSTRPNGHVKNVSYDWDWGFRVGAGWNFQHDGWDMLLNWTSFHTHESNRELAQFPISGNLVTWTNDRHSNEFAVLAKGSAKLRINLLDLELGREFFVSKWLMLRPFIGGRAAWVHRNLGVMYQALFSDGLFTTDKLNIHLMNRFNGGGLRAGLDSQWSVGCGWSFYGDFALSLLYGSHHLHQHQVEQIVIGSFADLAHIDNTWMAIRPMMDLALGIRWDKLFCNSRYRIRLQAGWEQHVLWGFEKDMNFTDLGSVSGKYFMNSGDLGLSGVAFQARFDF